MPHQFRVAAKRSQFRYSSEVNDALAQRVQRGGFKPWHFRVTSPSTISRWKRTWRQKSTNSRAQTESDNHLVASNINSLLQGATATSVQEIEKLISEPQALRDMLHSEAARVQHEIVQYSNLAQAALQSTKTITESLEQWRNASDAQTTSD